MDGLEGEATTFPLSSTSFGMSIFNLFLAWEDCTSEATWVACEFGLTRFGGGNVIEMVGQPRR